MDNLIGKKVVGYRYGAAPESGFSYNRRENELEPGVSMAQVLFGEGVRSFAVSGLSSAKKYYYIGEITGEGGDDEVCIKNHKQITRLEYLRLRKEMVDTHNDIINYFYDRKVRLARRGFIGFNEEKINEERKTLLK